MKLKIYFLIAILISLIGTGCFEPADAEMKSELKNACTKNDIKQFIKPDNKSFPTILSDCASKVKGDANLTKQCLVAKLTGLSSDCASCFGMLSACAKENCKRCWFMGYFSDSCLDCVKEHCHHSAKDSDFSLTKCTGLSEDKLPPRKP